MSKVDTLSLRLTIHHKLHAMRSIFSRISLASLFASPPKADDIGQEALLRALQSGTVIRHPRSFFARIARNVAIDEARKLKVRGGLALQIDALPDRMAPWVGPDQETALLIKQVILGLPELYRDVFILSRFHGLSYQEIAAERGITVKAVEYRMSRALALCEEALRD
jgi:RNA polymerase sigma factor (sigma-70 family)